jgi:hypothetical protein
MRLKTAAALVLLLISTVTAQEERTGQYYCVTTVAAGITKKENAADYAGKISLPEKRQKFFVTIQRYERNATDAFFCKSAGQELQEKGIIQGTGRTGVFIRSCLTTHMLTVNYGGDDTEVYRGNEPFFFQASFVGEVFHLYANNSFRRIEQFDSGSTVVSEGKCEKIVPPKR